MICDIFILIRRAGLFILHYFSCLNVLW
jgi:hypothetical protein